jgi:flagellar protein FliS
MDPRSAYREGAARGASGTRLVVLLYEQAIQDLRRAALALEKGDVAARTGHLNHAISVIGHLQATVDRDKGGQVGRNLDRLYCSVRARLLEAQVRASAEIFYEQIAVLLSVREAWIEVDRALSKADSPPASPATPGSPAVTAPKPEPTVWRG